MEMENSEKSPTAEQSKLSNLPHICIYTWGPTRSVTQNTLRGQLGNLDCIPVQEKQKLIKREWEGD